MKLYAILAASALALSASANAATIFSANFDGENGGANALNYTGFSNFTTTGQVDLVASPNPYGITCSGSCVDLDGTSGPGSIVSSAVNFAANKLVTISFDLSGSQRSAASDAFNFAVLFTDPTGTNALSTISGFPGAPALVGDFANVTSISYGALIAGNSPFQTFSLSFITATAGSFKLSFGTTSADNIGPLLDNVLATQTAAVPEPATWAMMIGGFALVGAGVRRRKTAVSFA